MGISPSMAKAVAFAVLAVVLVMRGAGAVQENVEDVVELPENPAAGAMGKCVRSIRALHSVCGLYGESSEACKETKAAHEHQCQSLLGESGKGDGLGCRNNNFDTEKKVICDAAKVVCNIPGRDYCETALLVNCMKSIGQMCPDSAKKRPNMTAPSKSQTEKIEKANKKVEDAKTKSEANEIKKPVPQLPKQTDAAKDAAKVVVEPPKAQPKVLDVVSKPTKVEPKKAEDSAAKDAAAPKVDPNKAKPQDKKPAAKPQDTKLAAKPQDTKPAAKPQDTKPASTAKDTAKPAPQVAPKKVDPPQKPAGGAGKE